MNPRYRRLLIPGLLVLLLVVVLIGSLADRAGSAEDSSREVCRITDPRVIESSGLALSRVHDGLAYTINDSDNEPFVFAVEVSTCRVVGATRVEGGTLLDTEAIAIDDEGTLWVADTGDNRGNRSDAALYALDEPGPGNRTVTAQRYPIRYDAGPQNVEALAIDPRTGAKVLISKALLGGVVFSLPSKLVADQPNLATSQAGAAPPVVTDATFTSDGSFIVVRNYGSIFVIDPSDSSVLQSFAAPDQPQGESIATESSGSLLVGSEGAGSALIRVRFAAPSPPASGESASPAPRPSPTRAAPSSGDSSTMAPLFYVIGAVAAAGVLGASAVIVVRRSR